MVDINDPKLWRKFDWDKFDEELRVPIKSQWKVNVARANTLKAKNKEWLASIRKANKKKATDPEWRKKVKEANNNWTEERRKAYENRDMSYTDKNGDWYKKHKENNAKSKIPVRVKQPNQEWIEYDSIKECAATTDDAKMFEGNPAFYFPKDMGVKTLKSKKSSYYGWQFQRLKFEQEKNRKD
jgi:HD superfamily phosphohydrolase